MPLPFTTSSRIGLLMTLLAALLAQPARALELPQLFASHMVLQRDLSVPVWGTAAPSQSVQLTFRGQRATTRSDAEGRWQLSLEPMSASAVGETMTLTTGEQTVTFEDVLVGDVWLCSGQSNMQWSIRQSQDADAEIASARHPLIRLATVARATAAEPQREADVRWEICSPETIGDFSAVAYHFGRHLQRELQVPIGLIHNSWGGTRAEAWTSLAALAPHPALFSALPGLEEQTESYPRRLAQREQQEAEIATQRAQWLRENPGQTARDAAERFRLPRKPVAPAQDRHIRGVLYNAMLHPLAPYGLRGVIWYQGEANAARGTDYRTLLPLLITDWRSLWQQERLPFGIVQLANLRAVAAEPTDPAWAHLRDAQRFTSLTVPDTGLAVTLDIGEANDIHPRNKQDVGWRLALWALHDVYGRKDTHPTGPIFDRFKVSGSKVVLHFRETGGPITTRDGQPPAEFILCGSDRTWVWAQATITGPTTLEVSAEGVSDPIAVRYAWADNPANPNLTNDSKLPASPFRTDDWPPAH